MKRLSEEVGLSEGERGELIEWVVEVVRLDW